MSASCAKPAPSIGFLTVVSHDTLGVAGGYLLLNAAGRPLEFHCTAPVKASRVQEILYGPTLKPFLYGEQLAQTLIGKSRLRPIVVCTDSQEVLAAREVIDVPMALVAVEANGLAGFSLGQNQVYTTLEFANDQRLVRDAWPLQAEHLDLLEPFTRIREALEEAQRIARQAA